jgi:RNA recognition motif-containing protein
MSNGTANTKLRISNLSPQTTDNGLEAAFMQYGTVQEAVIKRDRDSGKSRGFGFVSFPSEQESKAAFLGMNGRELYGSHIEIEYSGAQV